MTDETTGTPPAGGGTAAEGGKAARQSARGERAIVRMPMVMTPAEMAALDEWRYVYRLPTRTAAIKTMMRMAYEARPAAAAPPPGAVAGPAEPDGEDLG